MDKSGPAFRKTLRYLLFTVPPRIAIAICLMVVGLILGYITINGMKNLSWDLLFGAYSSENPSLLAPTGVTLLLVIFVSLFTFPIGVAAAIFQTEFGKRNSRLIKISSGAVELLAGLPSIIFGLFGSLFFGQILGFGYSLISGVLTMAVMTLPVIIRVTEESILAVNHDYRMGSLALGASRWHTVRKIILPNAKNGIITGFLLSLGRVVGETAPLILTLGTAASFPTKLTDSGRNLSLQMYVLTRDGGELGMKVAFASAFLLILIALFINFLASLVTQKSNK
ncbi:MAG: phosphate ABC transporter permease PstA [Spirochaetia bacterium]